MAIALEVKGPCSLYVGCCAFGSTAWNVNMAVLSTIVFTLISSESFTPALKYITNQSASSSHHRLFLDVRLAGSSCLVGLRWHRALADILTTSFEAAVCMLLVFRDDPHWTKTPFYLELGPLPWGHMQNITQQHKSIIWSSIGGISRKKNPGHYWSQQVS